MAQSFKTPCLEQLFMELGAKDKTHKTYQLFMEELFMELGAKGRTCERK
jgi:hypothetical protein